jgi:hypothetical protein
MIVTWIALPFSIDSPSDATSPNNGTLLLVFLWRPLYNVCSMIVLGFLSSALPHSLWNVGRRVFSIVMAVVWFQDLDSRKMPQLGMGMCLVTLAATWYTYEYKLVKKQRNQMPSNKLNHHGGGKLKLSLVALVLPAQYHQQANNLSYAKNTKETYI